jgi:RNA polymerase sigma factor (sigma-70 family)
VGATDKLLPLVYEELRLLAAQKLSHEPPGQTLQATALVHEAYLRLVGDAPQSWENRGHFFAAAAEAMRRILVENARRKRSLKRGGEHDRVGATGPQTHNSTFGSPMHASPVLATDLPLQGPFEEILALDESLAKLSENNPPAAAVVKLYYFAGLTLEQIALAQGLSRPTVAKRLAYGRAWLQRDLLAGDGT